MNAIETYIFKCIDFSGYPKQPETNREKISYLLKVCRSERRYRHYKTEREMFIDWCYGLPTAFNMDYMPFKIIDLCNKFGLKIPESGLFDFWYGKLYDTVITLKNK